MIKNAMKTPLILIASFLLALTARAQSAAETAQAALTPEQWNLVQAAFIEQRDALTAAHTAALATQAAASQQQLDAVIADLEKAKLTGNSLAAQMQTQLNADLTALQAALNAATDDTQRAVLAGKIALVTTYLQAATQTPEQLRAAALQAEIAARQAELAKLQSN